MPAPSASPRWLWGPSSAQRWVSAARGSDAQGPINPDPGTWPPLEQDCQPVPQRQAKTPALTPGNEQLCTRQAARQRQQAWLK